MSRQLNVYNLGQAKTKTPTTPATLTTSIVPSTEPDDDSSSNPIPENDQLQASSSLTTTTASSTAELSSKSTKARPPKAVIAAAIAKKARADALRAQSAYPLLPSMRITQSTCLDKSIFSSTNQRIIGQSNKQVILCLLLQSNSGPVPSGAQSGVASVDAAQPTPTRPLLLAFDQHAVHERIRLEKLRNATFNPASGAIITRRLMPPMEVPITSLLWADISRQLPEFERIVGLKCALKEPNQPESTTQTLVVSQIPSCFRQYQELSLFTQFLTSSLAFFANPENLTPANGVIPRPRLAPFLGEQLKSQACHGAIRFGEPLARKAAVQMISALTLCQQSFRCAHGRLLVKPLVYLPTKEEAIGSEESGVISKIPPPTPAIEAAMCADFERLFGASLQFEELPKFSGN